MRFQTNFFLVLNQRERAINLPGQFRGMMLSHNDSAVLILPLTFAHPMSRFSAWGKLILCQDGHTDRMKTLSIHQTLWTFLCSTKPFCKCTCSTGSCFKTTCSRNEDNSVTGWQLNPPESPFTRINWHSCPLKTACDL